MENAAQYISNWLRVCIIPYYPSIYAWIDELKSISNKE